MKHIWSVICRLSITDQARNNISLIEVLERIVFRGAVEVSEGPIVGLPLPLELVSLWVRSERDTPEISRARVLILSPDGILLNEEEEHGYEVDLTEHSRLRATGRFDYLPFVENGIYTFMVQQFDAASDQWKDEANIPLEIIRETSD